MSELDRVKNAKCKTCYDSGIMFGPQGKFRCQADGCKATPDPKCFL